MAGGLQEPGRRLIGRGLEGFLGHFLKGPVVEKPGMLQSMMGQRAGHD